MNHTAAAFAALCLGMAWTTVAAQVPDPSPDAPAWRIGAVELFPVGRFGVRRVDNLFSSPDAGDATGSSIRTADSGFVANLPFSHSRASLGYLYGWRDYGQPGLTGQSNHQARLTTELVFSSGLSLSVKDDYERGVLDTESFDPGREVPFVAQRFRRNAPEVSLFHQRGGGRRVGVALWGSTTRFDEPREAGFFDQDSRGARAEGSHPLDAKNSAVWSVAVARSDLDRPEGPSFAADSRSERRAAARVGARLRPSPALAVELQTGWASYDYESATPSNFRSWLGSVVVERNDPAGARFTATFNRDAYASVFEESNFLVSRQLRLTATNNARVRIGVGGTVSYYVNRYPGTVPSRRDRSLVIEAWSGWRLREWIEWRLEARRESRSSSIEGVAFDRNEWGVSLRFGG